MQSPANSRTIARLWRASPVVIAAILAFGYFFGAQAELYNITDATGDWIVPLALLLQAGILGFRYHWPVLVFWVVIALDLPVMLASHGELTAASFAIMVTAYNVRKSYPAKRAYQWILSGVLCTFGIHYLSMGSSQQIATEWHFLAALAQTLATYAVAIVIAELLIAQGRLSDILRERAELAERDRERNAKEAVQEERNLIARELHDIAAHHLTGIILSSQAVNSLIRTDPEQASEYLGTVQSEARTALDNIRQTVGLLRTNDETDLAPAPSLNDLPLLLDEHRSRGTNIMYSTTGDPAPLGTIASIAAYRMAQESLANVAKHAPGSICSVDVVWTTNTLSIVVANTPATRQTSDIPSGGHGLIGMRERAAIVQGRLSAGPKVDGGWSTSFTVPTANASTPAIESSP